MSQFNENVLELESILRSVSILLKKRLIAILKEFEITPSQFRALIILKKKNKTKMKHLVKKMHRKPPTATGIIDRLVKKGLVQRSGSKKDRRIVNVELTNKGQKLVEKIREKSLEKLQDDIEGFSENEINQFIDLLKKFKITVEENNE